jgi:two-component system invasion response regulator UvrY
MRAMINILLIDDSTMFTGFIRNLSDDREEFTVLAECHTGGDGILQAQRLKPDVILLDVHLPGLTGITVARKILQYNPAAKILVASRSSSPIYIYNLAKIGVKGYITKGYSHANEILSGLAEVAAGNKCFNERAASAMAYMIKKSPKDYPLLALKPQEIEVAVQLIADISDKRIYRLRQQLLEKLNVKDNDQLKAKYWNYFYDN